MFGIVLMLVRDVADLGLPPAIGQKDELREWLTKAANLAKKLAAISDVKFDDTMVNAFHCLVTCPECWDSFYSLLTIMSDGKDDSLVGASSDTQIAADTAGITPAKVILLTTCVSELIS